MADIEPQLLFQAACKAPFGWVAIAMERGAVCRIEMSQQKPELAPGKHVQAEKVCAALQHWFSGADWPRDIPVAPSGTDFQKRVWQALLNIPSGETRTYGELAKQLGSSPRAIGGACRRNPVPLLVPCHRVVAANGAGGFAGHTDGHWMDIKHWLLSHE